MQLSAHCGASIAVAEDPAAETVNVAVNGRLNWAKDPGMEETNKPERSRISRRALIVTVVLQSLNENRIAIGKNRTVNQRAYYCIYLDRISSLWSL